MCKDGPCKDYANVMPTPVEIQIEREAEFIRQAKSSGALPPDFFVTKDSGERAEFSSGMVRDTEKGKPRFALLIPKDVPYEAQFLTRFAALLARGAEKYDPRNWEKAEGEAELERYHSSAFRHLIQWITGETDEDHAAAVAFNLLAAETVKAKRDRFVKEFNEAATQPHVNLQK